MAEVVELISREVVVIEGESPEVIELAEARLEVVETLEQGPPGPPGKKGDKGDQGDPGVYDGTVAEVSPDPVLVFENALI